MSQAVMMLALPRAFLAFSSKFFKFKPSNNAQPLQHSIQELEWNHDFKFSDARTVAIVTVAAVLADGTPPAVRRNMHLGMFSLHYRLCSGHTCRRADRLLSWQLGLLWCGLMYMGVLFLLWGIGQRGTGAPVILLMLLNVGFLLLCAAAMPR